MIKTVNIDRIVRRRDFDGHTGLKVTSMFRTIQGEGPFAGYPAVFLRLAGCNFGDKSPDSACKWCDTFFSIDKGVDWDLSELLKALTTIEGYAPTDVLVVTGGEPTLQHNLIEFMKLALPSFTTIQVETNGTQAAFFTDPEFSGASPLTGIYTVVSPKAIYKAGTIPKPADSVLEFADCLKFVLSAEEGPHHELPGWALALRGEIPIYVSPMAVYLRAPDSEVASIWDDTLINRVDTAANYAYAAQYAMKHNLLLSLQTHLFTAVP